LPSVLLQAKPERADTTFTGLLVAIGGIVLGLVLEGGNLGQILQPTAAMIVFGGTFGAMRWRIIRR
jgi:flagellar motor component MotA